MEDDERKRRDDIIGVLAGAVQLIHQMLLNLDGLRLTLHTGPDMQERIAEDFLLVHRDVLPTVEAPDEVLAMLRSILLDWITLDSLIGLHAAGALTPARSQAMEELAGRLASELSVSAELWPGLFGLEE